MKTGALTLLLLSATFASPLLHLNFEQSAANVEKSSGLEANVKKADLTPGSGGEESIGRYIALVGSVGSWLKSIEWKRFGDYSHFLTLPGNGLPLYFNGTSATLHAVLGNIAAVGLSAYLVSQLPSSGKYRAGFRSDKEYYDDIDDYILDRDHDSDIYAFEDDDKDYDYQYPEDGWNYGGTSQRLKKDRIGGGGRRPRWHRRRAFRRHRAPGLLERIASFVSKPVSAMARVSHAVTNPSGFLKQFADRYDAYWEARRGGGGSEGRWKHQSNRGEPRPGSHSRYYYDGPQYRTDETAGPQLPLQNEAEEGAGEGGEHLSGGWENSAATDSFAFGKQIH